MHRGGSKPITPIMEHMSLLSASGLTLYYGNAEIFSQLAFEVGERSHIGMVGPNGSGKTSLLRLVVGEQEPNAGAVNYTKGMRIGYVPQTHAGMVRGTLYDEVMTAFNDLRAMERELAATATKIETAGASERPAIEARYADLLHQFEDRGGYTYHQTLERTVAGLGLSEQALSTPAAQASGGERTRAAMAKALLAQPDLLVLDEPTNHLDLAGLVWLERFLARFNGAFIVVSHDRYFLDRVVGTIWEIDHGKLRSFDGNYSRYRVLKEEQDARAQQVYEQQQSYVAKEEAFIRRYRAGQRAQQSQGRATRLNRLERVEAVQGQATVKLESLSASRTAQVVIRTKGLKAGFVQDGAGVPLLRVPDLEVERGARIAIIGGNGAGKTTLIKTLLGVSPPVEGTVALGGNVQPCYYRQGQDDLREDMSVIDALVDAKGMLIGEARAYLARFLFRGDDVFQSVSTLSGGQRGRLALARLLVSKPNLLVLDEPTNHLDIPSQEALEQVLLGYDGTLLLVSHDRQLISRLAHQLWIVEAGAVAIFRGSYPEWAQRQTDAPPPRKAREPAKPRPLKKKAQSRENFEQLISELESKIAEAARQLQTAAEKQNVAAVARLSNEHAALQAQLDAKWSEWNAVATVG